MEYLIKVSKPKLPDNVKLAHKGYFSGAGINRLLIHAVRYSDAARASAIAAELQRGNPDYRFMVTTA